MTTYESLYGLLNEITVSTHIIFTCHLLKVIHNEWKGTSLSLVKHLEYPKFFTDLNVEVRVGNTITKLSSKSQIINDMPFNSLVSIKGYNPIHKRISHCLIIETKNNLKTLRIVYKQNSYL